LLQTIMVQPIFKSSAITVLMTMVKVSHQQCNTEISSVTCSEFQAPRTHQSPKL
jgi:hypothetical protein